MINWVQQDILDQLFVNYSHLLKQKQLRSSMKVTFPKFPESLKKKTSHPPEGLFFFFFFLKMEGDLQAMCDVHHLAFPCPSSTRPAWSFSTVDGTKNLFAVRTLNTFTLDL